MGNKERRPFDWIEVPWGLVRYAGSAKGRNEPPIETFAIDLGGRILYGEIKKAFLPDRHDFNLEVVSFGWYEQEWNGSAPDLEQCAEFLASDLEKVQGMLGKALKVWRTRWARPAFLTEYPNSRFRGDLLFRAGWALTFRKWVRPQPPAGEATENSDRKAFEWIDFPNGRVRYTGGAKGRDEPPIETFAVELHGRVHYGEIRSAFLPNGNDFNLEIVSFGWPGKEWFGSALVPGRCAALSRDELETVQSLICKAVEVWRSLPTRPFGLTEDRGAAFQGKVFFRSGWALIRL